MPHSDNPRAAFGASSPDADRQAGAAAWAAGLIALQGIGLLAAGVYTLVRALEPHAKHRSSTLLLGVMAIALSVGVLFLARAARRRRSSVRAPLLVMEIICLPVAVTIYQGGRWYVGVPLGASALAVIVLLGMAGLLVPQDE